MTQADRVLAALKANGWGGVCVLDFPAGFRLAARIKDLRDAGHNISTETLILQPTGTKVAAYVLHKPTPTAPAPMTGSQEALPL